MSTSEGRPVTIRCPECRKLNRADLAKSAARPRCGSCNQRLLLDRPVPVAEGDFQRTVVDSGAPVLVDFYADWCGPCKMMAPLLEEVAQEHAGRLLVVKVDTDRAPGLSQRFGIRGIPTLVAFKDGVEVGRSVGFDPGQVKDLVGKVA